MNILIKSAKILDSQSDYHNTTNDILIEDGCITKIGSNLKNPKNYQEVHKKNLHVSQGWFDSGVSFGEPGFEERETIKNGIKTAALSGFTAVAVNPNTNPVIDTSSDVSFITSKAQNEAVAVYPIGTLTKTSSGKDLAELFDMKSAGAVAFYDYKKSISNPNLLKIALLYASNFGGLVCSYPNETLISGKGVMNENITSTSLGLKGIPALAEELQVARDLFLLEYTSGKLHIPTISTAKSVDLIREAKAKKLDISCSVAIHNLCFTDDTITDFDTNSKVLPPLRTETDVEALVNGVKDGTIDMVTCDHNPLDIELKKVEFDHAAYGTIGLESAFGALQKNFTLKKTIDLLTKGKTRFGVLQAPIQIGGKADITMFNPNTKYRFTKITSIQNLIIPFFLDSELKGEVYGIFANNKLVLK